MKKIAVWVLLCAVVGFTNNHCFAAKKVLIYTKNGKGYVHQNIPASIRCLESICAERGWASVSTADPNIFTPRKIGEFDALVFSNTNNEAFDTQAQRDAFKQYIQGGGGFVGIHSACGSERAWPWFWANLGAKFVRHPRLQPFDVKVIDADHPSTSFLSDTWHWEDECYYMDHLNPDIHVLLVADLTTVEDDKKKDYPGTLFGDTFPLSWCHEFDGGRQWYTALGHKSVYYQDEMFRKHLAGGIEWALGADSQVKTQPREAK